MSDDLLIKELSHLYATPDKVRNVLEDAGFNLANIRPPFGEHTSAEYWRYILSELDRGIMENGRESLRASVRKIYPHNRLFKTLAQPVATPKTPRPGGPYDIFISYNSADKVAVHYLAHELEAAGIKSWLDQWEMQGGARILNEIERAIPTVKAMVVCIGPHGVGPWQDHEIAAAVGLLAAGKMNIIPVVLQGATIKGLPLFLQQLVAIQCTTECDREAAAKLVRVITNLKNAHNGTAR